MDSDKCFLSCCESFDAAVPGFLVVGLLPPVVNLQQRWYSHFSVVKGGELLSNLLYPKPFTHCHDRHAHRWQVSST